LKSKEITLNWKVIDKMDEKVLKWGITLDDNFGAFLLGANINIGDNHCYLCIYLGFKTLVIGKDYFEAEVTNANKRTD